MAGRCKLCGGKLKNGICQECGMDNNKTDKQYNTNLNHSECEHESLTHVHEDGKTQKYRKPVLNQTRGSEANQGAKKETLEEKLNRIKDSIEIESSGGGMSQNIQTYDSGDTGSETLLNGKKTGKKKMSLGKIVIILIIVVMVFGVFREAIGIIMGIGMNIRDIIGSNYAEEEYEEYDPQQYADETFSYLNIEFAEAGEAYEQSLQAGLYQVGVDLPAGKYTLTGEEGMEIALNQNDPYIHYQETFDEELTLDGIFLVDDTSVQIKGGNSIILRTENAQTGSMTEKMANPLTETYAVTGDIVAGEDFPAGVYDIIVEEGEYIFLSYDVDLNEGGAYGFYYLLDADPDPESPSYTNHYRNIVLPEGTAINTDDARIILEPSQSIISEDYRGFYDNY